MEAQKVSGTGRGAYLKCSLELRRSSKVVLNKKVLLSGLAASFILLSPPPSQLANASENSVALPFENDSDGKGANLMMMRGRWFEVASLKRGFAGQGQEDCHCTQIYSRTPNPGPEFIEKYKAYLENFGYDSSKIKDTPQDCEVMSNSQLAAMMSMPGMQQALINQFPDLELKAPIALNPFTSVFDTFKKLLELYFK
ncbi:hypothetical protein Ahy_B07g088603 [Arachis hypogaea]|uniref:Lipocalin/cytosolic fatty-acid binding domain-containing protein n=1 Tax=Arachis hypogaea TaxID=3818 RepID=A0A444YEY5_ARAHY|nr:hypothetical protein Ahy_B07g088603 [Arachis hypogaea]